MQSTISKYECPICQYIFTQPFEIMTCHHTFCKNCIDSAIEHCKTLEYQ